MKKESLTKRAHSAAVAYLERAGMGVVAEHYKTKNGVIPILATEGDTLVRVDVTLRKEGTKPLLLPKATILAGRRLQMADYIKDTIPDGVDVGIRYDVIDILQIADDRALLHHHRAAYA